MKIGHLGAYNFNLGDNVAIYNIRKVFEKFNKNIEWINIHIGDLWHKDISYIKNFFKKQKIDGLIIGGGGLIETEYDSQKTNWKLPFNKEILDVINYPMFFVGVGINLFRGKRQEFRKVAYKNLKYCLDKSVYFSLRNDGSLEKLKKMKNYGIELDFNKIEVIPDPGLIYNFEQIKKEIKNNGVFQPAFNGDSITLKRFNNMNNLDKLMNFISQKKLKIFPHTHKDYKYFKNTKNFIIPQKKIFEEVKFNNTYKTVKKYFNYNFSIAMRGHGQLIAIGLNIPSIYFSTQDKVLDFSMLNGFEDYNVDILEDDWLNKLEFKYNKLLTDKNYLEKWYEIRNKKMKLFRIDFDAYIKKCYHSL